MIVVDQLPSWAFERRRDLYTHGFRRLLDQGAYVPRLELPYALTFTAPGHASLSSGTSAVEHGVFGNMWFRREQRKELSAEWDPSHPLLTAQSSAAATNNEGASGKAMRVEGIGDALKRQRPTAQIVSIALKARAACFFAGQHPDLALFYEPSSGGLTTSTYYATQLPAWVVEFNRTHPFSDYSNRVWTPLDAELLAKQTNHIDDALGEGAEANFGTTFPHSLAASSNPSKAFVATPYGDELILDASIAAVQGAQLGQDAVPDLLAISLNSHDFAGHNWGQESWEVLDLSLRQDIALGKFFERLDQLVGADRYDVVLTSDHGATPLIESNTVSAARRIPPSELRAVINNAMQRDLGEGPEVERSSDGAGKKTEKSWVDQITSLNVYMVPQWQALSPDARRRSLQSAVAALKQVPNIADAGIPSDIVQQRRSECGVGDGMRPLLCRSLTQDIAGELYVVPARGSLISEYKTGTHHDSPSDDNRFVPLLMWGKGISSARLDRHVPQINLAFAPTVAMLLGISPPAQASEKPLLRE
jgi:hypothetical protein